MPTGIRTTVEIPASDVCPIVELSGAAQTTIDSISPNICPPDCAESVTEFSTDEDHVPDGDVTRVFSDGETHRYRLTHGDGVSCPCECLGAHGCPVTRYIAAEGTLTVVFYAAEYDQLQEVVGALRERFPEVDIKRLVRSPTEADDRDSVLVDRGRITARQLEVLETAHEMGYFERPRETNATQVAAELDIHPSTFREHLTAAESKILDDLL
ncbi:helix-turn-helix domain-containing protein [Halobellus marinus]|jgi:predicted DNA binding protein|uniref:helix-turn-helix domain-containing protein n=1 Tax=Halobellus TaxID=1073986 RepID=UPI0028AD90B7|nr:helix-turn-helix domain-containing protein [Halobellus sp. DFY28]